MGKFNSLLNLRLKQKDTQKTPKMTALAERTTSGNLSSFSGIFRVSTLSEKEKFVLENILKSHILQDDVDFEKDLKNLMTITSEVKAITNQAVMLHGERIKKAQLLLKNYKDGAFTAWLINTYGNRQTPYNFLQYYEFYTAMPPHLHPKIDEMPRQAIYTLASRAGELEKKQDIINQYEGQPKQLLLSLIRKAFPLNKEDKRLPSTTNQVFFLLKRVKQQMLDPTFEPSTSQQQELAVLIEEIKQLIEEKQ
jgi:hypothetical protein